MVAADELPTPANHPKSLEVEHYAYGMHPDVARILKITETPNVCEVVPMQMVYEDSHGQRHALEYSVMGSGCGSY